MGRTSCNEYSSDRGSIKGKRLGDGPVGKNLIGQMIDSSRNYNKSAKIEEKYISSFSTENNNSEHAPLLFFINITMRYNVGKMKQCI